MAADCGYMKCKFSGDCAALAQLRAFAEKEYDSRYEKGRYDRDHVWGLSWLNEIIDGKDEIDTLSVTYDTIIDAEAFLEHLLKAIPGIHFCGKLEHDFLICESQPSERRFHDEDGKLIWNVCYECGRCHKMVLESELKPGENSPYSKDWELDSYCPDCYPIARVSARVDASWMDENKHITIPEGITCVVGGTFLDDNMAELRSVSFPESLKGIDNAVFSRCKNLKEITFPKGLLEIGCDGNRSDYCAFDGCTGLTHIEFPDGLRKIADGAFRGCTALTSIKLPDSLQELGLGAFMDCTSIKEAQYPSSVAAMVYKAFGDCPLLAHLELPDGLERIEKEAFYRFTSLQSIKIPGSVTELGEYAFCKCSGLTDVKLSEGLQTIRMGAFVDCRSLKSLFIPESVSSIEKIGFRGCPVSLYGKEGSYAEWYAVKNNIPFYAISDREFSRFEGHKVENIKFGKYDYAYYIDSIKSYIISERSSFLSDAGISNSTYDETHSRFMITTEVSGTMYDGRSERLEKAAVHDRVNIARDPENPYDKNAITVSSADGASFGFIPAKEAKLISPLMDAGCAEISDVEIAYLIPLSQKPGTAKGATLYITFSLQLYPPN